MSTFVVDEGAPILVEFAPKPGLREVSLSPADLAEKSAKALDSAMNTIHQMARRVAATAKSLSIAERPSQIEVEFGLKLDAAAGAVVAQASTEASFNVKLTWEREETKRAPRLQRMRRS
jgi:hypothetical protein